MSDNPQNTIDLSQLGLDPSQPFHHLNLAGEHGWPPSYSDLQRATALAHAQEVGKESPDPTAIAQATPLMTPAIEPMYGTPDMSTPALRPYDLQQPGITHFPEWTPDPDMPDLQQYNKPYSVDWPDGLTPPAVIAADIPSEQEIAASLYPGLGFPMLNVTHGIKDVDPAVPDLQHPTLVPEVQMQPEDRPGELDADAIAVMHADAHFQQTDDKDYPSSQMDAQGMNDRRARHMSLLTDGLD